MAGRTIGDLLFGFRGDGSQLEKDAIKAGGDAGTAGAKSFDKSFSGRIKALKADFAKGGGIPGALMGGVGLGVGLGAFSLITKGIGSVVDFMGQAVSAAMEEEASIAALTKSIEENSAGWDGNIEAVEKVIEARQDLAFADDEQRDSLRTLVAVTKDVTEALRLQRLAMDLARLRGMSLADAGALLGKVYGGNIGILKRYGIQLEKGATREEALAAIQKMSAGQAEAFAETTAGTFQSLQIAIDNIVEDIGIQLLPLMKGLAKTAKEDLVPAIKGVIANIGAVGLLVDIIAKAGRGDLGGLVQLSEELAKGALVDWLKGATDQTDELIASFEALQNQTTGAFPTAGVEAFVQSLTVLEREALLVAGNLPLELREALMEGAPAIATGADRMFGPLPEGAHDAVKAALAAIRDFAPVATATLDRVWNKKRKKLEWVREVHTQLRDIKQQFRDDLATINWLLAHPGQGRKTRNELVEQLTTLERKRKRALREKDWQAFGAAEKAIEAVQSDLDKLDGSQATVTLRMNKITSLKTIADNFLNAGGMGSYGKKPKGYRNGVPYYAMGTPYVPNTGLAVLHRGERVVTAEDNARLGGGMGRMDIRVYDERVVVTGPGGTNQAAIASPGQAIRRWRS